MSHPIHDPIRAFVEENFLFGQDSQNIGEDESFLESGIVDSTGVLQLVGFLEQRYGLAIADHELIPDNLDSLRKVSDFVGRKLALRTVDGSHGS